MLSLLKMIWRGLLAASTYLGIISLYADVWGLPETYPGLWRAWRMIDPFYAMTAFAGLLVLYVVWIDLAPLVLGRIGRARRIIDMEALASELHQFALEKEMSRPGAFDHLNYVDPAFRGTAQFAPGSEGNMVLSGRGDPFQARMMSNIQQERYNHERLAEKEYSQRFAGRVADALAYCDRKGLLLDEDERRLRHSVMVLEIGNSFPVYRRLASLLRLCAERLKRQARGERN